MEPATFAKRPLRLGGVWACCKRTKPCPAKSMRSALRRLPSDCARTVFSATARPSNIRKWPRARIFSRKQRSKQRKSTAENTDTQEASKMSRIVFYAWTWVGLMSLGLAQPQIQENSCDDFLPH